MQQMGERVLFTTILKWEHGVHFQCLATQNTMAALIGGTTVHHWAHMPVILEDARDKAHTKNTDGDVDALFEDCLGMRWLLLDEVSTFSVTLLGLLDWYLRRACTRHPHAKDSDGKTRTFGGLNIILSGDFWQLPPVRALSFFSNPYLKREDYGAAEQTIMWMFWKKDREPISNTFVLKKPMRTKADPWMQEVMQAQRDGNESWEMYCFIHGLPTAHTGSWLPSTNMPTCQDTTCIDLNQRVWPFLVKHTSSWMKWRNSWKLRRGLECSICAEERRRRCWVDPIDLEPEQTRRYRDARFADAPYVHPFNAPKYHAQQLRTID